MKKQKKNFTPGSTSVERSLQAIITYIENLSPEEQAKIFHTLGALNLEKGILSPFIGKPETPEFKISQLLAAVPSA